MQPVCLHLNQSQLETFGLDPFLLQSLDPPIHTLDIWGQKKAFELLKGLPQRGFGIVGSRTAHPRALELTRQTLQQLQTSGLIILSGLAQGIDQMAHEASLEYKIPTIAFLGSPLNAIYPPQNEGLAHQILASGGLLISEYPLSSKTHPHHFLLRNRLISAFSMAIWVVQAGERSGSLNTAKWCREQQKITFATPSFPGDSVFSGNQTLLDRDHALPFWGAHSLGSVWMHLASPAPSLF